VTAAPQGGWTTARVAAVARTGTGLVGVRLDVADRVDHLPGQHYVVRLRAPDDYTAQRSYSIASDPADPLVELMVERLPDGEVSAHLHDVLEVGDVLEVRGPLGGWFCWDGTTRAGCVVGGTGVVPAVSMLRHARRIGRPDLVTVVAVGRTLDDLPYAEELLGAGAFVALTREDLGSRVAAPPYPDEVRRLLDDPGAQIEEAFVCGSPGFATYAARLLGEVGVRSSLVKVEQFGPTR